MRGHQRLERIGLRWTELVNAQVIRTVKDADKQLREVSRGILLVPDATSMLAPSGTPQIEVHTPVSPQQTEVIQAPAQHVVVPPPPWQARFDTATCVSVAGATSFRSSSSQIHLFH
ncbi:MAG: hypothetical protein R3E01_11630 [Pirellulaceae bacterium]